MTQRLTLRPEEVYYRLRDDLTDLRAVLTGSMQPGWLLRVREQVRHLAEDFGEYLSWQEENGYLNEIEIQAPRLHERVVQLHDEQTRLLEELEDLHAQLQAAPSGSQVALAHRLAAILEKIGRHEEEKNVLALNAFNVEPGAMD